MSIKENYLIVDIGGAEFVGELGHRFKPPVYFHITIWCVMEYTVQWRVEVDIFGVLLGLVQNDGWHEALPIGLVKNR